MLRVGRTQEPKLEMERLSHFEKGISIMNFSKNWSLWMAGIPHLQRFRFIIYRLVFILHTFTINLKITANF